MKTKNEEYTFGNYIMYMCKGGKESAKGDKSVRGTMNEKKGIDGWIFQGRVKERQVRIKVNKSKIQMVNPNLN